MNDVYLSIIDCPRKEPGLRREYAQELKSGDGRRIRIYVNKDTYQTESKATGEAERRASRTGRTLRTYQCPYCMKKHLTSKPEHLRAA